MRMHVPAMQIKVTLWSSTAVLVLVTAFSTVKVVVPAGLSQANGE
jgi:hypothetical protein